MFNQKNDEIKIGDVIVVGSLFDGKFSPLISGVKAKVERIWTDPTTSAVNIDLDWGTHGKSKVFMHDKDKSWKKLSDFN